MKRIFILRMAVCAVQLLGLTAFINPCRGQEEQRDSLAGEAAAEAKAQAAVPSHYNIPVGSGGLNLSLGLRGEYVSNVLLTHADERDDYILVPELGIGAYFPIGQLNTINLNLGVAYYHYFKNTELNTQRPLINPNSEVAFNFYSGDFAFKVSESFYYLESPIYEEGLQFYNVYDTGLFARYYNLAGASMTWDLHDLVVTAGYHHENLWSRESFYDYIDRASELFDAKAMFVTSPGMSVGLETSGSLNNYATWPTNDNWRVLVGPALQLKASEFVTARLGGGYERIEYEPQWSSYLGLSGWNTYYAYGEVNHTINRFFSHRLSVVHDNQSGVNAANLAGTHVRYALTWNARRGLTVAPFFGVHFYDESNGPGSTGYTETFTYWNPGLVLTYQYNPHWRASLSWSYQNKDSQYSAYGYAQQVARLEILHQF